MTIPGTHSGLAKVAVQCSADTFVVNQSLVLRINVCGKNPPLRQAANRSKFELLTKNNQHLYYSITTFDLTNSKILYPELELIDKSVFKICELELTNLETEAESKEYFAHTFQLNGQNIKFRTAKVTPTKTGQFVAIWKRNIKGITEPYDISDKYEFYIIATRQKEKFGLFVFPKTILHKNKILSDKTRKGKRGIRVYTTWDLTQNKQAQKTQSWQTEYFIDLTNNEQRNIEKLKLILNENI